MPVTSLEKEMQRGRSRCPVWRQWPHQAARQFGLVFDQQVLAVESLEALRAQAAAAAQFPAEDTPLQVPPEVERLQASRTSGPA